MVLALHPILLMSLIKCIIYGQYLDNLMKRGEERDTNEVYMLKVHERVLPLKRCIFNRVSCKLLMMDVPLHLQDSQTLAMLLRKMNERRVPGIALACELAIPFSRFLVQSS